MTHQPPVPKGATSPYPLQPPPIPEEVKQRAAEAEAAEAERAAGRSRGAAIGIGAAVALGAAAAVSGLLYARRHSGPPAAARKATPKKAKQGKTATSRKAAASRR